MFGLVLYSESLESEWLINQSWPVFYASVASMRYIALTLIDQTFAQVVLHTSNLQVRCGLRFRGVLGYVVNNRLEVFNSCPSRKR